jgi:hypothetical protein
LAQSRDEENLKGVLDSLDSSSLAKAPACRGQNHTSRGLASLFAFGEEQLRQNPKCDVRSFQSCLPIRAVRPQSDLSRSSECKTPQSANRPHARRNQGVGGQLEHSRANLGPPRGIHRLRQSEIFGLKWEDIDFTQGNMSVTRSIVYGVVGSCKTESSQKPLPIHPLLADALLEWRKHARYTAADDWVFASTRYRGRRPYWGQAILRKYIRPVALRVGVQKRFGWHTFRHTYSTLLRSVGTEFKVMQELLRHSTLRSTLDVYTQAVTPAKHAAQAAVVSLLFSSNSSCGSPSARQDAVPG